MPLDLPAIEAREKAATKGPWTVVGSSGAGDDCLLWVVDPTGQSVTPSGIDSQMESDTLDFIAHARSDIPALIEEVKRLREALGSTMVMGKDGQLHDHECIGVHGYRCKAWCIAAREALK